MQGLTLCGCGWLGSHLARRNTLKVPLLGTSRDTAKLSQLPVSPVAFTLGDEPTELAKLSGTNPVVLNIPPGARKKPLDPQFVTNMQNLIDTFMDAGCPQLIFVSTTAVYGDQDGIIDETSALAPVTDSGKAHQQIENHLMTRYPDRGLIMRLAGLVGPDRHPVNFLAGRELDKGEQVVNLVHIDDVCSGIEAALEQQLTGEIFHLCSLAHPKRGDYYTHCAQRRSLAVPQFNTDYPYKNASGKRINAQSSWRVLGLASLQYPSPEDMCGN